MLNRTFMIGYWRNARWVLIGAVLVLVIIFFYPMQEMAQFQASRGEISIDLKGYWDWLSRYLVDYDIDLIVGLAMLSLALFMEDRSSSTGDLMFSLPVKRQTLFFTKWITGVGVIAAIFLLILVVTSIYYALFSAWTASPYWVIPQFALSAALAYTAIFTIMLLIQALVGNVLVGGAIGYLIPATLNKLVTVVVNAIWFNTGLPYGHPAITWLIHLKYIRFSDLYLPAVTVNDIGGVVLSYSNWGIKLLVFAAAIWLSYRLGCSAYAMSRAENQGQLVLFPQLVPLVKWGGAVLIGLAGAYLLTSPRQGDNIMLFDLLFFLGTALSYLLLNKTLHGSVGRGA